MSNQLTEQNIVDRAEKRRQGWEMPAAAGVAFAVTLLVGLFEPVHRFLHAHVDILAGVLAGTLLQSIGWIRDRWRWTRWLNHQ